MDLRLRIAEEGEYAGCMVDTARKTVAFKINHMSDLVKAMESE